MSSRKEYGNSHRIFLQAMMQRRMVDPTEMYELYEMSIKEGSSEPIDASRRKTQIISFIECLNDEINKVDLKLVKQVDEESELRASKGGFLILISIKNFSDDSAKWTMTFNPIELEYFKILIRHIMNNPAKEITNIFALHRGNDLKSRQLGTLESQNILNKLRDYHWLRFSNEKPEIRLGPRFIAEMGPFLKLMFQNQTNDCLFCRKLVIQSAQCDQCGGHYHLPCVLELQISKTNPKCKNKQCGNENLPKELSKIRVQDSLDSDESSEEDSD